MPSNLIYSSMQIVAVFIAPNVTIYTFIPQNGTHAAPVTRRTIHDKWINE